MIRTTTGGSGYWSGPMCREVQDEQKGQVSMATRMREEISEIQSLIDSSGSAPVCPAVAYITTVQMYCTCMHVGL